LWFPWLLGGAFVAGALDISYAITFSYMRRGTPPARLLQFVASGALGPTALEGGTRTALLGLGFHFLNAFLITSAFFAVASRASGLLKRPIITGAAFGIAVYVVMNTVVIPLSRIGPRPFPRTDSLVTGLLVHMFGIGVPIVLAARRAFSPSTSTR
jgi:uncharacterized membrane protein YagU involved in acid resistance